MFNSRSDERLMQKVASRNEAAFKKLYYRYSDRWFNFFKSSMFGNSETANDLLQELCIRIVTKASSFDHTRNFRVWSFSIARNIVKNEIRKNSSYSKLQEKYKRLAPAQITEVPHDMTNIKSIINTLNQDDRELFYLRFGEELKLKEIAEIQAQPLGTVKSRMSRMMKKLADKLNSNGGRYEV